MCRSKERTIKKSDIDSAKKQNDLLLLYSNSPMSPSCFIMSIYSSLFLINLHKSDSEIFDNIFIENFLNKLNYEKIFNVIF